MKLNAASMLEHDGRKCDVIFSQRDDMRGKGHIAPFQGVTSQYLAVNESAHFMSITRQI